MVCCDRLEQGIDCPSVRVAHERLQKSLLDPAGAGDLVLTNQLVSVAAAAFYFESFKAHSTPSNSQSGTRNSGTSMPIFSITVASA